MRNKISKPIILRTLSQRSGRRKRISLLAHGVILFAHCTLSNWVSIVDRLYAVTLFSCLLSKIEIGCEIDEVKEAATTAAIVKGKKGTVSNSL